MLEPTSRPDEGARLHTELAIRRVVAVLLTLCGTLFPVAVGATVAAATGPGAAGAAPAKGSVLASLEYLGNPQFFNSAFDVVPGTTVSLHWSGGSTSLVGSGVHFQLTATVPGFGSARQVTWPPGSRPSPRWTGTGWATATTSVSVGIPAAAAPGSRFTVALEACLDRSCDAPPSVTTLTVPASPTRWSMRPYTADFSKVSTFPAPDLAQPFAITAMPSDNSVWAASEFSHVVMGVPDGTTKATVARVTAPSGAPSVFRTPFAACRARCVPSSTSALSEDVVTTDGWVWTTFGGWRVYANGQRDRGGGGTPSTGRPQAVPTTKLPPNRSEVVAYDTATRHLCSYLLPGNNAQVAGVAVVGRGPGLRVWAVASSGPAGSGSLDGFRPSTVGRGCDGRSNRAYVLPASVRRLTWPTTGAQWPVQIAADPSSPTLWITDFNPFTVDGVDYSGIDRIDVADPTHPTFEQRFQYATTNTANVFGAKPWHIVAPPNSNYVYAIDNGDDRIIRIDKTTDQLESVSIPLTSDLEDGFGLAVSSGRLYFALANDYTLTFGRASTFGYVDLSSWPANGVPTQGVLYTGLPRVTNPKSRANYRDVAVTPSGQVGLTDQSSLVVLKPRR